MPVSEVADGMPVEANHVYVIANADLTMAGGALKLVQTWAGAGIAHAHRYRGDRGKCGAM
jgi:chemotaxis response regulator CheB